MTVRVAIVGAGPAGLMAAWTLHRRGLDVEVLDKGRRTGGRISTREPAGFSFDHGAQYFTCRDPLVRPHVDGWLEAGVVAPWTGRIVSLEGDRAIDKGDTRRWVGVPRMRSIATHLARGSNPHQDTRITAVEGDESRWRLSDHHGDEHGPFDVVLLTVPAPQAAPLLDVAPALAARAAAVQMVPCWAVMVGFDQPLELDFDGAFVHDALLRWVARNNSKPGRPPGEAWVLHADPDWSRAHLEDDPATVAATLLAVFFEATGLAERRPVHLRAHRWRYSQPTSAMDGDCLWDSVRRVGAAGDWCRAGGRVEGALLSGMALAERVLSLTNPPSPDPP